VSSWANLQATIIASQTAVGRQLLGPTLATTLYLAGIILGTLSITGLAIACSIYWTRTWRAQERLEYALLDWAFLRADDLPEVARQTVEPLLEVLNSWLGQFTMRVMPNFFRDPSVRSRLTSKQNAESFKPTMRYAPPAPSSSSPSTLVASQSCMLYIDRSSTRRLPRRERARGGAHMSGPSAGFTSSAPSPAPRRT
jgi:hypothetical protein